MNINILIKRSLNSISKSKLSNIHINKMILELKDLNHYKIISKINVTLKRENKIYKKNIFKLMNKKMKEIYNILINQITNIYHHKIKE